MSSPPQLRLRSLDYSVLQQCIHCGMCLPSCPTYASTGNERNSPRGRIALMRAIADGELELSHEFGREMNYCLGCLACQSACPAGVRYAPMLEAARADIESLGLLDRWARRFWRALLLKRVFLSSRRLRLLGWTLWASQRSRLQRFAKASRALRLLSRRLDELEPMAPTIHPPFSDQRIAPCERPARESPRYRVGLLTGCVQDLAFSAINRDTADVLLAQGCEVVTPRRQACCGSLHAHNGEPKLAKIAARQLIDAFGELADFDAIISNAGGCGSHLRHYGALLSEDPAYAQRALTWDAKLKDVHEWLDQIGLRQPAALPEPVTVAYHPSCHLRHGQGIKTQPERLLAGVGNLILRALPEADWCCGSAGIYSMVHPEESARLRQRKVDNILATGCSILATANPGCHLQLRYGLPPRVQVKHPVSLLAEAYRLER